MRRHLAILIVLSLFSLQAQSLAFHVHATADHGEDRDHHHGPAIHYHDDFDSARHVDKDDRETGSAIITMAVPTGTVSTTVIVYAELDEPIVVVELQPAGDAGVVEVRSHSPPTAESSCLRGPPTFI